MTFIKDIQKIKSVQTLPFVKGRGVRLWSEIVENRQDERNTTTTSRAIAQLCQMKKIGCD